MTLSTSQQISEILSEPGLLTHEQVHELRTQILPVCSEWGIIIPELVFRKWMTSYQAALLVNGQGTELRLGSYVILETLDEEKRIYKALHAKLRTHAAIKILSKEQIKTPAKLTRFLREIRAIAALKHPNVVHALDADNSGDRIFYVMEYVPGVDLEKLLEKQGVVSWDTAVRYTLQIAQALQYVAACGLIHRDLKPANIQVSQDGMSVKLLDLGLARYERFELDEKDAQITRTGMIIGTPNYMAPEQIRDARSADIRSDLYSLGCTLYHMVTGRPPFDSENVAIALRRQLSEEAIPAETLRPDLPKKLGDVIRTLMRKKPRDRYQHPSELIAALRPLATSAGDTINDCGLITITGLPEYHPEEAATVRTDEIPSLQLHSFPQIEDDGDDLEQKIFLSKTSRIYNFLSRSHLLISILIALIGIAIIAYFL